MKVSKTFLPLVLPMALLLGECDTAQTVKAPNSNYFVKYYGDDGDQAGVDMEVNADGTLLMLGTTRISGKATNLYLVKADPEGLLLWEKTYGGSQDMEASDLEVMSNGNIVVVGNVYASGSITTGGSRDILVMTLSADGATINQRQLNYKNFVTSSDEDDNAISITVAKDGGFLIAGYSGNLIHPLPNASKYKSDGLIIRLKADLSDFGANWPTIPAWGQGYENVTSRLIQMPNDSIYVFGYSKWNQALNNNKTDFDLWYFGLRSTDGTPASGVNTYGGNTDEHISCVVKVPIQFGESFLVAGTLTRADATSDVYLGRLRSPLAFDQTDPMFGPAPLSYNLGQLKNERVSVCVSQNSGYYLLTNSAPNGNNNFLLTKIAPDGSRAWSRDVSFGGQGDDFIGAVRELPDGRIALCGTMSVGQANTESKMVLLKVNKDGQFVE